ncbi:MAG: cupredoxin domain-containing protein [Actinomycetota bacterium]
MDDAAAGDGEARATTFDEPGSYPYECTLHPGMTGLITVTG